MNVLLTHPKIIERFKGGNIGGIVGTQQVIDFIKMMTFPGLNVVVPNAQIVTGNVPETDQILKLANLEDIMTEKVIAEADQMKHWYACETKVPPYRVSWALASDG